MGTGNVIEKRNNGKARQRQEGRVVASTRRRVRHVATWSLVGVSFLSGIGI